MKPKPLVSLVIVVILLTFFVIFMFQNSDDIELDFLSGTITYPLSWAFGLCFFIGLFVGWLGYYIAIHKNEKKEETKEVKA